MHAVNALCGAANAATVDVDELDELTKHLHEKERAVHPDGRDNAPDPEGNYPVQCGRPPTSRRAVARGQRS